MKQARIPEIDLSTATRLDYRQFKILVITLFASVFVTSQILFTAILGSDTLSIGSIALFLIFSILALYIAFRMIRLVRELVNRNHNIASYDSSSAYLEAPDSIHQYFETALDNTDANIMIADSDNTIIYMNQAAASLFEKNEAKIKQHLPQFEARKLIGSNMDAFHRDPAHQQHLVKNLDSRYVAHATIADITFSITASPIYQSDGSRLGTVVEWQDISLELAAKDQAIENSRLRQALDSASANIMVADADHVISYMNDTVQSMFQEAESDIREVIPDFTVSKLIGQNMDVFHKNPKHQRSIIENLESTYTAPQAHMGSRTFKIVASPIFGSDRSRLGTVVEWQDISAELAVEGEVNEIVARARTGDLKQRIGLENKTGFYRSLSEGINDLVGVSDNIISNIANLFSSLSQGDLTSQIEGDYEGAFERLKKDANTTVERLIEVMLDIRNSSNSVSVGAEEISKGNQNLSQRTEEQSASLEETAASMEQMTATVQQNASNAQEADAMSKIARDTAEHGGQVVHRAVEAMSEIEQSSKEISAIISTIDEIAFQTNLLALNASVEAARAGEQGRGFAVVAEEVRNLAQRSATAAQEIKTLIETSSRKVTDGSKLVRSSGDTLQEIIEAVEKVKTIVSEISTASTEQAAGINEVNQAITQLDEITQHNAALVEESATAAQSMSDQARDLKRLIEFFKVNQ